LLEGLDDMIHEALVDFPEKLEALVDFSGKIGKFPDKYLGLHSTHASYDEWTSSLCSTKSEDEFRAGKGKLLSMAGRETLVKMCANFTPSRSTKCVKASFGKEKNRKILVGTTASSIGRQCAHLKTLAVWAS
jgi:hypothetical protein